MGCTLLKGEENWVRSLYASGRQFKRKPSGRPLAVRPIGVLSVFSIFQIPITDSRSFLTDASSRLTKPTWPIPTAQKDFVRQFGMVHQRRLGGLQGLAGEEVFCRASNAIRPKSDAGIISGVDGTRSDRQQCIFRRFFFEGRSVGKLEIGLRRLSGQPGSGLAWDLFIRTIAQSQWVVGPHLPDFAVASPLIAAGDSIANLYLRSTTSKTTRGGESQNWCVSAGEPLLVIEFRTNDFPAPPGQAVRVPLATHPVDLNYQRVVINGRLLHVWYLGFCDTPMLHVRLLRLHLLRFHAEMQSLKAVLRNVVDDRFTVVRETASCEDLQFFLRDALRLIAKHERYGVDQKSLRSIINASFDFVSAGQRESLLVKLKQIRRNILRSVEAQTVVGPDSFQQITVLGSAQFLFANEIKTQGDTMTTFNIKFGDYTTFHGDLIVAQSIQDSFNTLRESTTNNELKSKLEELTKEIAEQCRSLPESAARQLAEDVSSLVKESLKQSPRREWYELSAKGIIQAASALGVASEKIVGLVKGVLSLLTRN